MVIKIVTRTLIALGFFIMVMSFQNCSGDSSPWGGGEPYPGPYMQASYAVMDEPSCPDGFYTNIVRAEDNNQFIEARDNCNDLNAPISQTNLNWKSPTSFEFNGRLYQRYQ